MKSLIKHQLPKKTDRVVFCGLSDNQKEAYERFLDSEMVEVVRTSGEDCECDSGNKKGWCCHKTLEGTNTSWKVNPPVLYIHEIIIDMIDNRRSCSR